MHFEYMVLLCLCSFVLPYFSGSIDFSVTLGGQKMLFNLFRHELPNRWVRHSGMILASCWCAGMMLGILAAASAGEYLTAKMRSAASQPVSIIPFLAYAPFLLSAVATHLRHPWLILPCCITKAFLFGYCAFAVTLAFGQSSWLVRYLFLFSDVVSIPIVYVYWLRCIKGNCAKGFWLSGICLVALLLVSLIDYFWIAPFLADLI